MTDEEADAFMKEHDWAKWSDCRRMVQAAHFQGHKDAPDGFRRMSVIAVAKAVAAELRERGECFQVVSRVADPDDENNSQAWYDNSLERLIRRQI